MQQRNVYHVVTDRPMQLGQRILFDDTHHSGVYQRVMERVDQVRDVYENPEKYELPLDHHLDVALRELVREEVRRSCYPEYPSRMSCLYVSRELEEAERWGEFFARIGRPTYAIVEMRVEGRCFIGDACNCFDGTPDRADNLVRAKRYWENLPNEEGAPVWEMPVDGEIEVVRIVREINANIPV